MDKELSNKQGKKVTIFALFLSLVSIGILILGFLIVSSNKVILLQSISNLYKTFGNTEELDLSLIDKLATSKKTGIKANIDVTSGEDKYKIDINYLENKDDEKTRLDLIINYLDEEKVNGSLILKDNKVYSFLKDVTEKFYYTDYDYRSFINTLDSKDYEQILDYFKDSVDKIITNDAIKKEKTTIKYNDKDKKVNKLVYTVHNKEVYEIFDSFIKYIKSDKNLYKNISNFMGISTDTLDNEIDEFLNSIPNDNKELYKYNVYYYGFNKIVRYELNDVNKNKTISYQENKDNRVITIVENDEEILSLNLVKDNDTTKYDLTYKGFITNTIYKLNGTYSKDKLEINMDEMKIIITGNLENKVDTYNSNIKMDIYDGEESILSTNININYYFDKDVEFDDTDSVSIEEIDEVEMETIMTNLYNSPLYELFGIIEDMEI